MAKKKRSIPQQIFLWVFQIVIVVLFAFVLVYFFGQTRACIGQSMSTTIEGGDAVLLDGLSYKLGNPKRNDVIAFQLNGNREGASSIKRILGVPGETIQIKDGMIYIDGEIYLEKKDYPAMTDAGLAEEPITLGTNQYFVLGDNRNDSIDSREPEVGAVRREDILGRAVFRVWPLTEFGFLSRKRG